LAHAQLLSAESPVRLKVVRMGDEGGKGFGIQASRNIGKGELIYELIGLMAIDSVTSNSGLSEIHPHKTQVGRKRDRANPRVLVGPLRYVNHVCKGSNVSVSRLCCDTTSRVPNHY
jgi:hypothetical protein